MVEKARRELKKTSAKKKMSMAACRSTFDIRPIFGTSWLVNFVILKS